MDPVAPRSNNIADDISAFVKQQLQQRSDPLKAAPMAAYMKTDMPFYGVQKKGRVAVMRAVKRGFQLVTQTEYEQTVIRLWEGIHREEKYLAIQTAQTYSHFITPVSMPLYQRLIREGAWWDLVDDVAIHLVGRLVRHHRAEMSPALDRWIDSRDLWIRRSAIIAQVRHKEVTDAARLFRYCRQCAHEKQFFIRKAIGWGLRDYSYTAPHAVLAFLDDNRKILSGLSFREGARGLRRMGYEI